MSKAKDRKRAPCKSDRTRSRTSRKIVNMGKARSISFSRMLDGNISRIPSLP